MKLQTLLTPLLVVAGLGAGLSAAQAQDQSVEQEMAALTPSGVPAEELRINYDVNMGGFSLGGGQLRMSFTDEGYVAQVNIRTSGLAEWLFQSRYLNTSEGTRAGREIHPAVYTSDFRGRRDTDYQVVRIGYDGATPYLVESDPSYGRRLERFPVTEEQRAGSYDPLNAAVHLIAGMAFSQEHPCGEVIPIFDGRRRYNLNMEYVGREDIRIRNGEVWDGEVLVCRLNYEEIAGFKPQPEDDELPRPPLTIYIAEIEDGRYYVPVRVRAPTPIGYMVMVASHIRIRDVMLEPEGLDTTDVTSAAPRLAPTN